MKNHVIKHWPTLLWALVVFVLAVLIRLPSCYESFWVDELHTAWAIWGDFADVSPRAAAGNQTPLYFRWMWVWKAMVGESEIALRLSSVLAVALGSALLVVGVRQTTQRLSAGVLAGAIMAVESNAIFFGTEFRPYAFVMLLSVIATWAAVCLIQSKTKIRGGNLRLIYTVTVSLAVLIHPTSLVTLGLLTAGVLMIQFAKYGVSTKFQISDIISLILVAAVVFSLAHSSLGDSWENRSQWRAFGQATSLHQLWTIWPWIPLAIVPVVIAVSMLCREPQRTVITAMLPLVVGVMATIVFFTASYYDWVPLWHRRYFVAVLPMLAWSAGGSISMLPTLPTARLDSLAYSIAGVLLIGLLWQQGTLAQWQRQKTQLVFRGEDWRGGVEWLNELRQEDETVILDAGLIESSSSLGVVGKPNEVTIVQVVDQEYFVFPLSGPYFVADATHQDLAVRYTYYAELRDSILPRTGWIVARTSKAKIDSWLRYNKSVQRDYRKFGSLHIVRYEMVKSSEWGDSR